MYRLENYEAGRKIIGVREIDKELMYDEREQGRKDTGFKEWKLFSDLLFEADVWLTWIAK